MPRVVARAPTRIDFGGGWTDVPPYPALDGGTVCNIAIARYATVTVDTDSARDGWVPEPLVRAALRGSDFHRAHVSTRSDFPISAGLGGSSAAGVALAGALASLAERAVSRYELAMQSRSTEVEELGVPGGYQDHFAASFGGALLLGFRENVVDVQELALSEAFVDSFERRAVLIYTGESRISGDTIVAVRDAYLGGVPQTVNALERMKSLALSMAEAVRGESVDDLARLVGEHWIHQRSLHQAITTPLIDEIIRVAHDAGSLGAKALGASGGGCVLCIASDGREAHLREVLAPLGELLPFSVDRFGFSVI